MQLLRIASDLFDYLDGSDDKKTSRKRWASMDNTVRSNTVSVVLFTIFTIFLHCPRISSYVPYPPHHYFESPDLISRVQYHPIESSKVRAHDNEIEIWLIKKKAK